MNVVLVSSPQPNAGKTAYCVALGQRARRLGQRVGYRRLAGKGASEDAEFARGALRLSEPAEALISDFASLARRLPEEVDFTLIETDGSSESASSIAMLSGSPPVIPLIVARFTIDHLAEAVIRHADEIGAREARVLINVVPEKGLRQLQQTVRPTLEAAGLRILGIVPQDQTLLGTTVGELARALEAEVLCARDGLDRPVEAIMIAAMSDEGAEPYFRRHARKAVVAAGDRPDVHLPALETDTSCIILTEGRDPDPTVLKTADEYGVPLLKVGPDTLTILDRISEVMSRVRFHQAHKIARALAHFSAHSNVGAVLADLGVSLEGAR